MYVHVSRCAVSWTGVARLSSVKEKNLGESWRAKKLVIINKPFKIQDK